MGFLYVTNTDAGIERTLNEDNYLVNVVDTSYGEVCLAIVCDGVGGLSHGDKASSYVVTKMDRWFRSYIKKDIDFTTLVHDVNTEIENINFELIQMGFEARKNLGTTISAILFIDGNYYTFHIGDTRIYKYADGLRYLTFDHTVLGAKIMNGQITEEEARKSKEKNVLLQCVGVTKNLEIHNTNGTYDSEDVFLLCSDGQYNQLNDGEIEDVLEAMIDFSQEEMQETALELIESVKYRGERDNITSIFIKLS
ncbi:PP2C family protein-serine/threonine phosphatase [Anaeromicropila populeti]|uniref:Serine/threonine protein phosphatase PrpC n=1 Tax=Anaeromicropila populeti TaxID=37658 RepID=A0A1I6L2V2_9FIRM|nr:protein phosphatase 2C domain-containing protein [Anaeromicropila populeti]SFR97560.1 Serine/threonine protein phosphatase PrpC [Anaeromicropila populeti]